MITCVGIDCYVMVGRGLGGTPNLSEAAFHGARTSDLREAARVLRQTLPSRTSIFVVGTSMGGIIVVNALARGVLTGLVDGCISISGCFDASKNTSFSHSIDLWQPLLTHGLKESFVAPIGALKKMKRRMGPLAGRIVEKINSVISFDKSVVTSLHNFRDLNHYYSDMSGANDQRLSSIITERIKNQNDTVSSERTSLLVSSHSGASDKNKETDADSNMNIDIDVVPLVCHQTVYRDALKANTLSGNEPSREKQMKALSSPVRVEGKLYVEVKEIMKDGINRCFKGEVFLKKDPPPSCSLPVPLLAIHAADDPILHIDVMPCHSGIVRAIDNLVMKA